MELPRTVPRVHDRVEAGLLAEMSGEKIPSKFVPSTLEMAQLPPVDHSRESGSSRAGLDPELAGEGDQESARKSRRDRTEQGRCDHAPSGEVGHVSE